MRGASVSIAFGVGDLHTRIGEFSWVVGPLQRCDSQFLPGAQGRETMKGGSKGRL